MPELEYAINRKKIQRSCTKDSAPKYGLKKKIFLIRFYKKLLTFFVYVDRHLQCAICEIDKLVLELVVCGEVHILVVLPQLRNLPRRPIFKLHGHVVVDIQEVGVIILELKDARNIADNISKIIIITQLLNITQLLFQHRLPILP